MKDPDLDVGSASPPTADVPTCGSRLVMSPDDPMPTVNVCAEPAGHRGPHDSGGCSWTNIETQGCGWPPSSTGTGHSGVAGEPEATTKEASEDFRDSGPTPAPLPEDVGDGRQVWPVGDVWCISEDGAWLPGVYASRVAAILAFDAPDDELVRLRDRVPGAITEAMLRALLPAGEPAPTPTPTPTPDDTAAVTTAGGMTVPDEIVEAGTRAALDYWAEYGIDVAQTLLVRREVEVALAAAAPLIAAQALRTAASDLDAEGTRLRGDPFRSGEVGCEFIGGVEAAAVRLERRADELEPGGGRG